jgi:toxin ParE1/3/4
VTNRIVRHDAAWQDLDDLAAFIQKDSPQAAIRFLEKAEESFRLLARSPELGGLCTFPHPRMSGIRVWSVKGFPNHLIFYRPIEHGIEVVRVLHGARDIEAVFEDDA